jgi:hypothetical protein
VTVIDGALEPTYGDWMRRGLVVLVCVLALTSCLGQRVATLRGTPAPPPAVLDCAASPAPGTIHFDAVDGACLPTTDLQMVQCALDEPSVIVRGSGTPQERRYLGGPYRVAVDALPPGARLVGTSSAEVDVYAIPHEPSRIWVRDALGLSRWLTLPETVPWRDRPRDPSAFFIGDSITEGASTFITASLPGWTTGFDAVIGRPSDGGIDPAITQAHAVPPPDVVVVELGTNDSDIAVFKANALRILSTLRGVPLVVWQTTHGPMSTIPQVNAVIHDLVPRFGNTAIADWHSYVSDSMLVSDGVHPQTDFEDSMATLVSPILDGWRAAMEGRGATACLASAP